MSEDGEGVKIILGGKGESIEDLRKKAAANKVDPHKMVVQTTEKPTRTPEVRDIFETASPIELADLMDSEDPEEAQIAFDELKKRIDDGEVAGRINRRTIRLEIDRTLNNWCWQPQILEGTAHEQTNPDYYQVKLNQLKEEENAKTHTEEMIRAGLQDIYGVLIDAARDRAGVQGVLRRVQGAVPGKATLSNPQAWIAGKMNVSPDIVDDLLTQKLRPSRAKLLTLIGYGENEDMAAKVETDYRPSGDRIYLERQFDPGFQVEEEDEFSRTRETVGQPSALPDYFGAVFTTSRYRAYAFDPTLGERGMYKVPVLDVSKASDRYEWVLRNMRAMNEFPQGVHWKDMLDHLLADLKGSVSTYEEVNGPIDAEGILETERDIIALMAVQGSARAMEDSNGAASKYAELLIPGQRGPDMDKVDTWGEYLLHGNPKTYNRVIKKPEVEHYYKMLLWQAGIDVEHDPVSEDEVKWNVNPSKFKENSLLIESLRDKAKKGGFEYWITTVLKDELKSGKITEKNYKERAAAARLACDAFLTDKFSRWVYEITDGGKEEETKYNSLNPTKSWGGDPLRGVLNPSFLPGTIKGMYKGEDHVVLDLMDAAFRPEDIVGKDSLVPATMLGGLKNYIRLSNAMYTFIGGSRANELPLWSRDVMGKSLPDIVELLDQVYGGKEFKVGDEVINGKTLVGDMVARMIACKALAAAAETSQPGFLETMTYLLDSEGKSSPFFEVKQFLWGKDFRGKDGWIRQLVSARTRLDMDSPRANEALEVAWQVLSLNDQDARDGRKFRRLANFGFTLDVIKAIAPVVAPKQFRGK